MSKIRPLYRAMMRRRAADVPPAAPAEPEAGAGTAPARSPRKRREPKSDESE